MRTVRRLPPVLRRVRLVGALAILAALGIYIWPVLVVREQRLQLPLQLTLLSVALTQLGLNSMLVIQAYKDHTAPIPRPRRAIPWLDTWRGQLIAALVLGALPSAAIVVALVSFADSPLLVWGFCFVILSGFLWLAASAWVTIWLWTT